MQFRALIPPGVSAGDIVRVNAHGVQLRVRVPKHSHPGDPMIFDIDRSDLLTPEAAAKLVLEASLVTDKASSGSPLRRSRSFGYLNQRNDHRHARMPWICNEFGVALGMTVLIALSMVSGFLLGILYVTQPLGPNGEIPPMSLPTATTNVITKARQGGRTIMQLQPVNIHRN